MATLFQCDICEKTTKDAKEIKPYVVAVFDNHKASVWQNQQPFDACPQCVDAILHSVKQAVKGKVDFPEAGGYKNIVGQKSEADIQKLANEEAGEK